MNVDRSAREGAEGQQKGSAGEGAERRCGERVWSGKRREAHEEGAENKGGVATVGKRRKKVR